MNPDLEKLIRLQQLETTADDARRRIADHPERRQVLDARLQQVRDQVAGVKARLAEAQEKRRADEKEVSTVQTRLAKYKDQLLEVKTNREYTAMLHEIEAAQNDIKTREDRILEIMMESDELSAELKKSEAELKATEKDVAAERSTLEKEVVQLEAEMNTVAAARAALVAQIDRAALAIFETTAKGRKGVAVAEARNGLCTICHVRLRPQIFNEVRKNESIIQCDSCRRILYFAGENAPAAQTAQPVIPAED
jgi:predicted  nucleic acid-binding Zn-ribbon protein